MLYKMLKQPKNFFLLFSVLEAKKDSLKVIAVYKIFSFLMPSFF